MPWHVAHDIEGCSGYAVVKDADSEIEGCHETEAEAMKQMAALYANEPMMHDAEPAGEDRAALSDELQPCADCMN
jgi:hypothetical protein